LSQQTIPLARYILLVSIGTLIEWYDFFVVGIAAALVWPLLYYPPGDPAVAFAAALATYGAIFFSRPIGALIFGHLGDKIGRKTLLIWTLILTGIGMAGLALAPTYAAIGIMASILILIFRLIQGLGLGGEYGGAATILTEFVAESKRRGFYTSFLQATTAGGAFLAMVGLFLATAYMSREEFINIGWRILIGVGAIALIVGAIIRYRLIESPVFQRLVSKGAVVRSPSILAFKREWKKMLLLALVWTYIVTIFAIIFFPTGLSYMTLLKIPPTILNVALLAGALAGIFACIIGGTISDIIGRKRVLLISAILTIIASYSYYALVNTLNPINVIIANIFLNFSYFFGFGALAAFLAEQFLTYYRYTSAGFSYQLGAAITGIFTAFLLPFAIVSAGGLLKAWLYIFFMATALCILSIITNFLLKETKDVKIE
jgi:MHS family shikimate/dehydroshikimate transporter-like MFS transporter